MSLPSARVVLTLILVTTLAALSGGCSKVSGASAGQLRWRERQGGLLVCETAETRLQTACKSMLATADVPVRLYVLDSTVPNAWSWPTGEVYVSSALLPMLSDDELAAVVGHELGHLISDGHLRTRLAIASASSRVDVESNADAIACKLLNASAIDARAMRTALHKLAAHPATDPSTRRAIELRLRLLALA